MTIMGDTLPASMRRIAGYHFGWWDEHADPGDARTGISTPNTTSR
jgi:hypothetical protein